MKSQHTHTYSHMINLDFCSWKVLEIGIKYGNRAERHDLKSRLWLFFSSFLFPLNKRGKKKRRINRKNDFKLSFLVNMTKFVFQRISGKKKKITISTVYTLIDGDCYPHKICLFNNYYSIFLVFESSK